MPKKKKAKPQHAVKKESLANLKPAKPGEVRNPLGINRKRPYTDRMYQKSETLLALSKWGEKKRKELELPLTATWADAAIEELNRKAANGDIQAIKEQADRIEGKAPERLEISGPEKKEITVRIIHDQK